MFFSLPGLVLLIAQIACAVHAGKTGRPFYWLYIIIFIPMLGMLGYLAIEILPELLRGRGARRAAAGMGRVLDPGRDLREAERRLAMTPTAENKAAVAEAYLATGRAAEATALFQETLVGVHATDPSLMLGLARAYFAQGRYAETVTELDALRAANPEYHSPEGHLIYARSLEEQGKTDAALEEYAALEPYYPGQEARCRYALLLAKAGRTREAERLFREICQAIEMGPRHQRREQREWYDIARRAVAS
ncbi:MAG TPA: tetratricopeptide repeat protein [Stellaceae bacterium]|nr:tetratricopeptide repeat protein [Stellaceae bacterium]